jgi:putative sterol carrier protein
MADVTPKDVLETEIPAKISAKPQLLKEINAVYEFVINGPNGGTWTLDATEAGGGKTVAGSTGGAKCVVTVGDADFINIVTKKTNAQMAFMSGKLKVKGDMGLALKLQKILG